MAEDTNGDRRVDPARKAFLYRQQGRACGYLALADAPVTGYREPSARYREAAERGQQAVRPGGQVALRFADSVRMPEPSRLDEWAHRLSLRGRVPESRLASAGGGCAGDIASL
jgi:hypothetical protein